MFVILGTVENWVYKNLTSSILLELIWLYIVLRRKKEQDQVLLIVHMSPVLWLDKNPLRGQVDALRDEKTLLFRIFVVIILFSCIHFYIFLYKSLPLMVMKKIAMYWNLCCNKPYVWNHTIRKFDFSILKYDISLKLQTIT